MNMRALGAVLLLAAPLCADEVCRSCHPAQYETQSQSRHFRALRPIGESELAALLRDAPIRERNGVAYDYQPQLDGLRVAITKGEARLEAVLAWAFGAGAQAYTPVGSYNGRYFEHRVSYYTTSMRPGRTLGHPGEPSKTLESALGIPQEAATIERCFDCHATGVRPGPDLSGMRAGITCERCHGPGGAHAETARRDRIIALSKLTAAQSVSFCAECHRAPPAGMNPRDPMLIRFQPVGLVASDCFRKSRRLSCITCHDPHQDARKDHEHYSAKCLGCHPTAPAARSRCARAAARDCLPCHMQRRSPAEFLTFTDHHIRVYR
jgi:hypothetical protein